LTRLLNGGKKDLFLDNWTQRMRLSQRVIGSLRQPHLAMHQQKEKEKPVTDNNADSTTNQVLPAESENGEPSQLQPPEGPYVHPVWWDLFLTPETGA
jgi:hypothetical protein